MKLSYFNARALAEGTRLMLAQAEVEYEDFRWEQSEFADHKPNMKWGTAPMLEDDDVCLGQSKAIARYIANKYGFAGKDNLEQYAVDATIDTLFDFLSPLGKWFFSEDEEEKSKILESFKEGAPTYITSLVTMLEKNGGKHMVGDSLTWADISVYAVMYNMKNQENMSLGSIEGCADMMDTLAPLMAVYDMVAALPNVQKWVETRPQTKY